MLVDIAAVVIAALSLTIQAVEWIGGMKRNRNSRHRK